MSYDDPNCEECNEERRVSELAADAFNEQQKWLRKKHEADVARLRELARACEIPAGRGSDRSDPTLFEAMQSALARIERTEREYIARGGKLYIVPSILPKGSAAGLRSDDPRVLPHNPEVDGDGS